MLKRIPINNDWRFTPDWEAGFAQAESVRLPHTCKELPLHMADCRDYQMVCGYERTLELTPEDCAHRLFLRFWGAAHIATVYVNGRQLAENRCGYTAFTPEITGAVHPGENTVQVKLDTRENGAVPPFGFLIDYLTYGGLYREVELLVRAQSYISDVFVTTPDTTTALVQLSFANPTGKARMTVLDSQGQQVYRSVAMAVTGERHLFSCRVPGAKAWDSEHPNLYTLRCELLDDEGRLLDREETVFGFRTIQWKPDGMYLNGKKTFLMGLNRHQSFPYIGYAAPASLQVEDARILKQELGCSIVRTSHYPQSQHFLDACDRLGLLVFTEIPGWQYVGDQAWQDQACENVRQMVLQYRNHPSIVLWGVRINESFDYDAFYTRTNRIAHQLDPSRATSGVRNFVQSHLLEDVYAFNDFSHTGGNPGVLPKEKVTPDMEKPLLISECNGHMYPTKSYDTALVRLEQAKRHLNVQEDARARGQVGCIGWCMFDYPTHGDFGSGDKICYHGVLDAWRNPKLAAAVYASQGTAPVLEVGSSMDIGDYPGGNLSGVTVFTNAPSVKLYKNDKFVRTFYPRPGALPHEPVVIDDMIGSLLEQEEGFSHEAAEAIKDSFRDIRQYGLDNLPPKAKAKLALRMARYHLTYEEGLRLYGKYVNNWGGEATRWRFEAGGLSVTKTPGNRLHLEVRPSSLRLTEGETYDMAALRVRILDENNNVAPYCQLPVRFRVNGALALVGPETVTAEGGMCGAYVRTLGRAGTAEVTVETDQTSPVVLTFAVEEKK